MWACSLTMSWLVTSVVVGASIGAVDQTNTLDAMIINATASQNVGQENGVWGAPAIISITPVRAKSNAKMLAARA